MNHLKTVYPTCCRLLESIPPLPRDQLPELADFLDDHPELLSKRPYLADLARIEAARHSLSKSTFSLPQNQEKRIVNPNLLLLEVHWQGLPELLGGSSSLPRRRDGFVLVWLDPADETVRAEEAEDHDLLALKIVTEGIDTRKAATEGGVSVGTIDNILLRAEAKGLLLAPDSLLVRPREFFRNEADNPDFLRTPTFTLQWHLTQTCDLHCRHCYDRSDRPEPELAHCINVLDQLYDFGRDHHVFIQVSFSGGNPLLYPHFDKVYREAAARGFLTAILGNPMPRKRIEDILAIQKPEFYQVSLEGLREHNDYIRGPGHLDRVLTFLDLLRESGIYSMVMLTLTRANMDQVLELAEVLRDRVDLFTFNRLAMVGEGASLESVPPDTYPDFLRAYLHAAARNPCMGLKDNLINIIRRQQAEPLFGGCAGHGCGAAFNFMALLPDGEVHACRKLPSLLGNIHDSGLHEIYHGEEARLYRAGSRACEGCRIRPVCGGCLAVAHGFGLDVFAAKDPYCFL